MPITIQDAKLALKAAKAAKAAVKAEAAKTAAAQPKDNSKKNKAKAEAEVKKVPYTLHPTHFALYCTPHNPTSLGCRPHALFPAAGFTHYHSDMRILLGHVISTPVRPIPQQMAVAGHTYTVKHAS